MYFFILNFYFFYIYIFKSVLVFEKFYMKLYRKIKKKFERNIFFKKKLE